MKLVSFQSWKPPWSLPATYAAQEEMQAGRQQSKVKRRIVCSGLVSVKNGEKKSYAGRAYSSCTQNKKRVKPAARKPGFVDVALLLLLLPDLVATSKNHRLQEGLLLTFLSKQGSGKSGIWKGKNGRKEEGFFQPNFMQCKILCCCMIYNG